MSIATVREYLKQFGRDQDVLELDASSATVPLAAQALGVLPAHIAKTLSFRAAQGAILVVTAGDAKVDNKKFKATFGLKARMLSPEEVLSYTGHPIGGVCPFALPENSVTVYLDESLRRFPAVYPACGSGNSAIKLNVDELYQYSRAVGFVDVCKDWEETP